MLNIDRTKVWASCTDIDPVAAYMCYIQLSLCGIPAEVIIGNTLTMQYSRKMKTFAYYADDWESRIKLKATYEKMSALIKSQKNDDTPAIIIEPPEGTINDLVVQEDIDIDLLFNEDSFGTNSVPINLIN